MDASSVPKKEEFEKNTRISVTRHFDDYFIEQVFFNILGSIYGI